jgi:hypothetical protein
MGIAPGNPYPEKPAPGEINYDRKMGSETRLAVPLPPGSEGVARDTDVPRDFARGAYVDTAPYRGNQADTNPEHVFKRAEETTRERSHVGSASWVEAESELSEFADGAQSGYGDPHFTVMRNPGVPMRRENIARVG